MMSRMYQVKRPSRSEFIPIRNLSYHVQIWGTPSPAKTPLVLVHGWMDVAASYQFVVDALSHDHYVIAPDWRGYGQTGSGGVDNFWFPDYLADLDFLLDHYSPNQPVNLVGHSMGGNVVMLYGGVRPERICRLVNLEGFGMPATTPDQAPERYAKWMDELKKLNQLFNIEEPFIQKTSVKEIKVEDESVDKKEADFELARRTYRSLIERNDEVIDEIVRIAKNSESSRAFEVAGQLLKAQADITKELLNSHKQKKDIDGESGNNNIKTQNNIVFAGSTSDLMKMISAEKAKVIDAKD